MKRAAFLVLAICSCGRPATHPAPPAAPAPAPAPSGLHGHVFDGAGRPLALAHVTRLAPNGSDGEVQQVRPDGSFAFATLPSGESRFLVSGADHRDETLLVTGSGDVMVKLGTDGLHGAPTPFVILLGPNENASFRMKKEGDGIFAADVTAQDGRRDYMIGGVANDGAFGLPIDGIHYDGHGRYRAQIDVKGGHARVTFDPKSMHETPSSIAFDNENSESAELSAVALRVSQSERKMDGVVAGALHAEGGPAFNLQEQLTKAFDAEGQAFRADLAAVEKAAHHASAKNAADVAYFHHDMPGTPTADEKARAARVLQNVRPDDPIWAVSGSLAHVLKVAPNSAYADSFIAQQPDDKAVAAFCLAVLEDKPDVETRRKLVAELRKPRYEKMYEAKQANAFDPDRKLAPGKEVSFEVASLNGKGKLTPKDFAGKFYLIDVWGTWCVPCVAEMPRLHALYAKYAGPKFEMLSIALESDAKVVDAFRKDKAHPMPWKNGIADPQTFQEGFAGPGLGNPFYVLVDDKGKVIDTSPTLEMGELHERLDRLLKPGLRDDPR